ncbi:MAG: pectinesterase, partial [Acetatifactor sp.]|nr:pectinesterase [Acetatifactor sp.]
PQCRGDDPALTGEKVGDENSQYFRQQNGLAWEGEHVDYNSVIGEYTDSAYEGIASGRYPSGMENVIRDYFENLNK